MRAADVLAPESTALSNPDDVAQLGDALVSVVRQAAGNPMHVFNVGLNLAVALAQVPPKTLTHWLSDADTVPPGLDPKDRRFSDPAWNGNPFFVALRLAHAAASRSVLELIDPPGAEPVTAKKARMLTGLMLDAFAPDQLPGDQSGSAQTCLRNRWTQSAERRPQFRRRRAQQRWPAATGRHLAVRLR